MTVTRADRRCVDTDDGDVTLSGTVIYGRNVHGIFVVNYGHPVTFKKKKKY